jgi:hypothetical protein
MYIAFFKVARLRVSPYALVFGRFKAYWECAQALGLFGRQVSRPDAGAIGRGHRPTECFLGSRAVVRRFDSQHVSTRMAIVRCERGQSDDKAECS